MKAVLSTVSSASVSVGGEVVSRVSGPAMLALIGAGRDDSNEAHLIVARKIAELRLFPAAGDPWDAPRNSSALDVGAEILVVSQFTLLGRTVKGRRPSWADAAPGEVAEPRIEEIIQELRARGLVVKTGQFGAMMSVESVNEGPYTVLVEVD